MAAGVSKDLKDDTANIVGGRVRCAADDTFGGVSCNKLYHYNSLAYRVGMFAYILLTLFSQYAPSRWEFKNHQR